MLIYKNRNRFLMINIFYDIILIKYKNMLNIIKEYAKYDF